MYSAQHFCPILTKFGIPGQVFIEVPSMKCHGNLLNGSCALIQEGIGTDGRDEGNRLFALLKLLVLLHLSLLLLSLLLLLLLCVLYFNFSASDIRL